MAAGGQAHVGVLVDPTWFNDTSVHAAARRDRATIVRTIPLDTRRHLTETGQPCSHTLVAHNGAAHEAHIDDAAEMFGRTNREIQQFVERLHRAL